MMQPNKSRVMLGAVVIALMAAFLILPFNVYGQTAKPKTPVSKEITEPEQKATSTDAAAIPVPEIAIQAAKVTTLLRDLKAKVVPDKQIVSIGRLLPEKAIQISRQSRETEVILEGVPNLGVLQTQQLLWQQTQVEMSTWLQITTGKAKLLSGDLDKLTNLKKAWSKTRDEAKRAKTPQTVFYEIDDLLKVVAVEILSLETQLKSVLDLQGRIVREVKVCDIALSQIAEAQQSGLRDITARDSIPIWIPVHWTSLATAFPERLREVSPAWLAQTSRYARDPATGLPIHLGLFTGLVILFWAAHRRLRRWKTEEKDISSSLMVLERPFAAALLITLGMASGPYSGAPAFVKMVMEILIFVPMIRLIKPVTNARVLPELCILWFLFAIDTIRQALSGGQFTGQLVLIIEALVGAIVLIWSLVYGYIHYRLAQVSRALWTPFLRAGTILLSIILTAGAVAGILGYLSMARILASEVVAGATMALGIYAVLKIVNGIVAYGLRVWPLGRLYMAIHHRGLLERKTHRVLVWLAVIIFVGRLLNYLGFLNSSISLFRDILLLKLERGSVSISVEDVLVFFLTVWIAYLVSAFLRFVLQEDVYPRIGVQKGMAYATSSLINYVILAVGFVVGLGVIGVSLTKMTVLAGAFGVGIGFGLQSIVNNFVSGLILLFERPLHVGDTIEVGNLTGDVRRIGIRASTIRTSQGADIVVPNADLITKQVTNWTLGDKLRRIDLPVVVKYGANPEEVMRILETVSKGHPDVLQSPAPEGLFTGYGDSSINFELRAWTDKIDDWQRIRSDLAVAVYHAGHEAGITFPFSQREARIRSDSDTGTTNNPESEK
jgi:potassium efflux system protein